MTCPFWIIRYISDTPCKNLSICVSKASCNTGLFASVPICPTLFHLTKAKPVLWLNKSSNKSRQSDTYFAYTELVKVGFTLQLSNAVRKNKIRANILGIEVAALFDAAVLFASGSAIPLKSANVIYDVCCTPLIPPPRCTIFNLCGITIVFFYFLIFHQFHSLLF